MGYHLAGNEFSINYFRINSAAEADSSDPHPKTHCDDQSQDRYQATHHRSQFEFPPGLGQRDADFPTDSRLGLGDSQEPFPGKTTFIHDCQLSS